MDYTFLDISGLTKSQEGKINKMLEEFKEENKNIIRKELLCLIEDCEANNIIHLNYDAASGKCEMIVKNENGEEEKLEYEI